MEEIKRINKNLERDFGKSPDDRPWWKLSFTTGYTEKRFGTINKFYGHIFLAEVTGVHEVLKYPYEYQRDKYVLERLIPAVANPELTALGITMSYEPVWMFADRNGEYIKPNWKAINLIVRTCLGQFGSLRPKTQKELDTAELEARAKSVKKYEEMLDMSYTASMIANREAIIVPASYIGEK